MGPLDVWSQLPVPCPTPTPTRRRGRRGVAADADAVLAACRLLVDVRVQSMSAVQDQINIVQLRILTVIASHEAVTLSELAAATELHISRASRACDRVAADELVAPQADPQYRRSLRITLTSAGARIVTNIAAARRRAWNAPWQR